jgi:hypothetical protein
LPLSIVFAASRCDRFWCETGAVIAAARSLRLRAGFKLRDGGIQIHVVYKRAVHGTTGTRRETQGRLKLAERKPGQSQQGPPRRRRQRRPHRRRPQPPTRPGLAQGSPSPNRAQPFAGFRNPVGPQIGFLTDD